MLSQYYNRHSSLSIPKKQQSNHQEDDIINSFYQERKSRTNANIKQHNLLRKNISYFTHEGTSRIEGIAEDKGNKESVYVGIERGKQFNHQSMDKALLSRPPLPKQSNNNNFSQTLQNPPKINQSSLKSSSFLHETSLHNISQPSSNFSSIIINKAQSQEQDYKKHLKSQLNKRINIKHYLTEISEENKENKENLFSPITNNKKNHTAATLQLKYNYDAKVPHRQDKPNIQNPHTFHSNAQQSRVISQCKQSRHITDSRVNNQSKFHSQSRILNQSQAQSRHSLSSILHDAQNGFQFSRNDITDRIQTNKPRQQRQSLPTLGDSAPRSTQSEKKTEKPNILREEQLQDLQQNSHPIRQHSSTPYRLTYQQPQLQAEYKRKIQDLSRELQQQKAQHKREDKFIQSIFKMRRIMDNKDQDCSLKELWRWIKQLPQRK